MPTGNFEYFSHLAGNFIQPQAYIRVILSTQLMSDMLHKLETHVEKQPLHTTHPSLYKRITICLESLIVRSALSSNAGTTP